VFGIVSFLSFVTYSSHDRNLDLESTGSGMPLARLRHSPADLHASQTSGSNHARVYRALRNELIAAGR
jgi:hypothetical protein